LHDFFSYNTYSYSYNLVTEKKAHRRRGEEGKKKGERVFVYADEWKGEEKKEHGEFATLKDRGTGKKSLTH
jgi:hypothetical protein